MSNNYVNNKELLKEILKFKENNIISEELGDMLLKISNNYSSKGSFAGYTWRSDMVSEAVLTCIRYLKNFNPEKSTNAFAYVTQICKNSFKLYIKKQKTHSKIKDICYKTVSNYTESISYTRQTINYEDLLNFYDGEEIEDDDKNIEDEINEEIDEIDDDIEDDIEDEVYINM